MISITALQAEAIARILREEVDDTTLDETLVSVSHTEGMYDVLTVSYGRYGTEERQEWLVGRDGGYARRAAR